MRGHETLPVRSGRTDRRQGAGQGARTQPDQAPHARGAAPSPGSAPPWGGPDPASAAGGVDHGIHETRSRGRAYPYTGPGRRLTNRIAPGRGLTRMMTRFLLAVLGFYRRWLSPA